MPVRRVIRLSFKPGAFLCSRSWPVLLLTSGGDHAEDLKKLEGTWIAVSWQWGDDLRTEEGGLDIRYEIKGDEVTSRNGGGGSR